MLAKPQGERFQIKDLAGILLVNGLFLGNELEGVPIQLVLGPRLHADFFSVF